MYKINTKEIKIPAWGTPKHALERAFNDGKKHAVNHYYCEEPDPDWPQGINSWSINPYTENRPGSFYCWIAGFCEQWAELKSSEKE